MKNQFTENTPIMMPVKSLVASIIFMIGTTIGCTGWVVKTLNDLQHSMWTVQDQANWQAEVQVRNPTMYFPEPYNIKFRKQK